MSCYTEVTVTPEDLKNRKMIQTTIAIERSDEVLLSGTVYNSRCEALEGAVVLIMEIYPGKQRVKKGYVITNRFGEFAVTVSKNKYVNYQLDIYEPFITG
ncbi:hypothetical protein [Clostridium sp. Marseille-P2415]|uniref:hypothetical protein n=1 Tax=Clostridium sp. Marseille-P2415 TaxID=1805471 RepID=UPI0009888663|nr:hypothetical protein [Clostridium sp. Marseille-P2415]